MIFYSRGQFFSRKGIGQGRLTPELLTWRHHVRSSGPCNPAGVQHGPQPRAAEAAARMEGTSEVAVMIECRNPLTVCEVPATCEDPGHSISWARVLGLLS